MRYSRHFASRYHNRTDWVELVRDPNHNPAPQTFGIIPTCCQGAWGFSLESFICLINPHSKSLSHADSRSLITLKLDLFSYQLVVVTVTVNGSSNGQQRCCPALCGSWLYSLLHVRIYMVVVPSRMGQGSSFRHQTIRWKRRKKEAEGPGISGQPDCNRRTDGQSGHRSWSS